MFTLYCVSGATGEGGHNARSLLENNENVLILPQEDVLLVLAALADTGAS